MILFIHILTTTMAIQRAKTLYRKVPESTLAVNIREICGNKEFFIRANINMDIGCIIVSITRVNAI